MNQAAEYRRRAAEDEALARIMSRNDYRDYFLEEARQWRARAAAAERHAAGHGGDAGAQTGATTTVAALLASLGIG